MTADGGRQMADNSAAHGVLRAYLALEEPGYALLIDAPWGAGKTHFIQHHSGKSPDELRYVTLNGVADEAGFRRAILKDSLQADLLTTGTALAQTLSKLAKVDGLGQLASDYAEEALLRALPPTLVFDDLERATLPPEQLLGLINDYVEHQGKRVILLVNSEAHARKDAFLARKEKIVGRTITITPDVTAALPAFLAKITEGKGRKYLEAQTDLITDVFRQSDHGNLRLLRNALRNCAPVLWIRSKTGSSTRPRPWAALSAPIWFCSWPMRAERSLRRISPIEVTGSSYLRRSIPRSRNWRYINCTRRIALAEWRFERISALFCRWVSGCLCSLMGMWATLP